MALRLRQRFSFPALEALRHPKTRPTSQ